MDVSGGGTQWEDGRLVAIVASGPDERLAVGPGEEEPG